MKVFKAAFIKSFEAPQRRVKLKIKLIFSLRLGREGLTQSKNQYYQTFQCVKN